LCCRRSGASTTSSSSCCWSCRFGVMSKSSWARVKDQSGAPNIPEHGTSVHDRFSSDPSQVLFVFNLP
jgi:hypothetical protein